MTANRFRTQTMLTHSKPETGITSIRLDRKRSSHPIFSVINSPHAPCGLSIVITYNTIIALNKNQW